MHVMAVIVYGGHVIEFSSKQFLHKVIGKFRGGLFTDLTVRRKGNHVVESLRSILLVPDLFIPEHRRDDRGGFLPRVPADPKAAIGLFPITDVQDVVDQMLRGISFFALLKAEQFRDCHFPLSPPESAHSEFHNYCSALQEMPSALCTVLQKMIPFPCSSSLPG